MIENFSRHEMNLDQRMALWRWSPDLAVSKPRQPFFNSVAELRDAINGKVVSLVAPGDMMIQLWASQLGDNALDAGTTVVLWQSDPAARARGKFAARGVVVYQWESIPLGCGCVDVVMPVVVYEDSWIPSVENDFRTGDQTPYQG